MRVSLTERISIEAPSGVVVDEQRFPGRQGRIVFAYLLAADGRPVPRHELADALWGDEPPARWEKALSVIVSKLRALLGEAGLDGAESLSGAFGCYQLTLPADSWIDVTAAGEAASAAEQALASGNAAVAIAEATTAASLARRTFLPGEDGRWVSERRADLREILVRALECLADAARRADDAASAVRSAEELVALEPFRERGYRLLMQAQSAAGNDAEALRTYERCRTLLAEELGAYPSSETEGVYLEILRGSPKEAIVESSPDAAPPGDVDAPVTRGGRKLVAAILGIALLIGAAVAAAVIASGDVAPLVIPPTSVVRIDPDTLEPTQAVRTGPRADLVVAAGGYVWITHGLFRYVGDDLVRDAGDRVLTRVDPSTGEATVVGGGLAPCGLTADPSGDVWVANCFASERDANVVRVDAETLEFEKTISVPGGAGFFRGITYGGGSLWVANVSGGGASWGITEVNPQSGSRRSIPIDRHAGWLAWADGYGDLWLNSFGFGSGWGSVSRLNPQTSSMKSYEAILGNPATLVVDGDAVWIGAWNRPDVIRVPALGPGGPRVMSLPTTTPNPVGVTTIAAGAGYVWATVPSDHAVWRIDPATNEPIRIALPYYPWGVAASDDGIWVSLRANDAP
ncbi:MAG TPA: BTAD domain-containing putative transcriptional regulator [Gaiellaceae bacterium]|nr:BTAD domain-containing putative transcriptional regulator [Gaiellaceae bacterium]